MEPVELSSASASAPAIAMGNLKDNPKNHSSEEHPPEDHPPKEHPPKDHPPKDHPPVTHGAKPRRLRLLSLDGGGISGYSSLLILQRLMQQIDNENIPKPCEVFDMIGGTSTGGLIAIMLGRLEMTVDECISAFITLSGHLFQAPRNPVDWKGSVRPRYDSSKLEYAIKHILRYKSQDKDAILVEKAAKCKIFVCATRGNSSRTVHLRNYVSLYDPNDLNHVRIWEAGRATSAAPSYFDPITIGRHHNIFLDGGVSCNNPVEQVFAEAMDVWSLDEPSMLKERIECMVSIGTSVQTDEKFRLHWLSLPKTLSNIATETEATAERFVRSHPDLRKKSLKKSKYFRFNVAGGLDQTNLAHHQKMGVIETKTMEFLDKQLIRNEMRACADKLDMQARASSLDDSKHPVAKKPFPSIPPTPVRWIRPTWYKILSIIILTFSFARVDLLRPPPPLPPCHPYCWLDRDAPIFAVMGKTGVGKSTFIGKLGGRHVETGEKPIVGHNLASRTENLTWYEANFTAIENEKIYLIDTPGFDDSRYSDADILKMITFGFADVYKRSDKLIKGIIFMHDISQTRIGGLGKGMLKILQKLVGHENLQNVALVTTKWMKNPDPEEAKRQIDRVKELREIYWADMIGAGSKVMEYTGTRGSAYLIISTLLRNENVLLHALREIVDEEKEWEATEAGQVAEKGFWSTMFSGKGATKHVKETLEPQREDVSQGRDEQYKEGRQEEESGTVPKPRQPLSPEKAPKGERMGRKDESVRESYTSWLSRNSWSFIGCAVMVAALLILEHLQT